MYSACRRGPWAPEAGLRRGRAAASPAARPVPLRPGLPARRSARAAMHARNHGASRRVFQPKLPATGRTAAMEMAPRPARRPGQGPTRQPRPSPAAPDQVHRSRRRPAAAAPPAARDGSPRRTRSATRAPSGRRAPCGAGASPSRRRCRTRCPLRARLRRSASPAERRRRRAGAGRAGPRRRGRRGRAHARRRAGAVSRAPAGIVRTATAPRAVVRVRACQGLGGLAMTEAAEQWPHCGQRRGCRPQATRRGFQARVPKILSPASPSPGRM